MGGIEQQVQLSAIRLSDKLPLRVDWGRLAEPQCDRYDALVCRRLAGEIRNDHRPDPDSEKGRFGTRVRLANVVPTASDTMRPAPLNHPNIECARQCLKTWPRAYELVQQLLETIYVVIDQAVEPGGVVGSTCGAVGHVPGKIFSTVNSPMGLAEAIVHETAHAKLRMLGIDLQTADRLIVNDPSVLHPSPIRYDSMRPMTAVFHAQYSYVHVAALDNAVINSRHDDEFRRALAEEALALVVPKLKFGREVIGERLETDKEGDEFAAGFADWQDRVIDEATEIMRSLGVPEVPFQHPLMAQGNTPGIDDDLRFRVYQSSEVVTRFNEDEFVVEGNDRCCRLNAPAAAIWGLCDGRTVEQLVEAVASEYGLGLENLRIQVSKTVDELRICGVVYVEKK